MAFGTLNLITTIDTLRPMLSPELEEALEELNRIDRNEEGYSPEEKQRLIDDHINKRSVENK